MRASIFLSALSLVATVSATASPKPDPVAELVNTLSTSDALNELFKRDFASELEKRSWIDDLVQKLINDIKQGSCEAALTLMKWGAKLSQSIFLDVVEGACKLSKVEDADVCTGIVALEGPTIAETLKTLDTTSRTAKFLCSSYLGFGAYPTVITNTAITNGLPAVPQPRAVSTSSGKTYKFVHVSDMHVDRQYTVGANFNCSKPICCRPWSAADGPGGANAVKNPAGQWGSQNCDTPEPLEQLLYDAIQGAAPDCDFMIFTGDLIEAAVWLVDQKEATDDINAFYNKMSSGYASKNGKKVFPVVGNHDTAPVNLFPIDGAQWVYSLFQNLWSSWVGSSSSNHWQSGSYTYLARPGSKLRIISLSTNFWYKLNFNIYKGNSLNGPSDPQGMLAWFKAQLAAAKAAGESVFVIGHMPLGLSDAVRDHSHNFNQITRAYADIIKGMFWGHTHTDEFEITYSSNDATQFSANNALITSYVAPAVTPRQNNPSFRVYTVDAVTNAVIDYVQYAANIDNAGTGAPIWHKVYSAKETYGRLVVPNIGANDEMSPSWWHKVTQAFESNDSAFKTWFSLRRGGANAGTCDADCKRIQICQMRASGSENNCDPLKPDFGLKKRAWHGHPNQGVGTMTNKEWHAREKLQHKVHAHYHVECGPRMPGIFAAIMRNPEAMGHVVTQVSENAPKTLGKDALAKLMQM